MCRMLFCNTLKPFKRKSLLKLNFPRICPTGRGYKLIILLFSMLSCNHNYSSYVPVPTFNLDLDLVVTFFFYI